VLSAAAVALMAANLVAQAKPNFAGQWKIAGDPDSGGDRGRPGVDLTITQSATAMTVEYRAGVEGPAPVKLTFTFDGSADKNKTPGAGGTAPAEHASSAIWAADKLVVTTRTGVGDEKRTFSAKDGRLVVETSASAPTANGGAPKLTRVTYQRYERGHGG
jgi:hypothetical protein